jgi:hypothetical protein
MMDAYATEHTTTMTRSVGDGRLADYLNDHLAGADVGVRLAELCAGEARDRELDDLPASIRHDREVLQNVMTRLRIAPSKPRRALALAVGAVASVRQRAPIVGSSSREVVALEDAELLSLGIEGKTLMWRVLKDRADARLQDVPFDELIRRARSQRVVVERHRRRLARHAFAG